MEKPLTKELLGSCQWLLLCDAIKIDRGTVLLERKSGIFANS